MDEYGGQFDDLVYKKPVEIQLAVRASGIKMHRSGQEPTVITPTDWDEMTCDGSNIFKVYLDLYGSQGIDIDETAKKGLTKILKHFPQLYINWFQVTADGMEEFFKTFGL